MAPGASVPTGFSWINSWGHLFFFLSLSVPFVTIIDGVERLVKFQLRTLRLHDMAWQET